MEKIEILALGATVVVVLALIFNLGGPIVTQSPLVIAHDPTPTPKPSPTPTKPPDGTQGCTPGFWRNHTELWDGAAPDLAQPDAAGLAGAPFTTGDSFNAVFGVTSGQSGLADSVTLGDAVRLGGGGLNALARHAVAALISAAVANSVVDYGLLPGGVIAIYQDAVGAVAGPHTVSSAQTLFATENEKPCPLS